MAFDKRIYAWCSDTQPMPTAADGVLAGLRLGVKDLFHIAGLPTGAGNPDWLRTHPVPDRTSPVVSDLLAAGAVLVAKTQTDELAYSLNGLNRHYGAPTNPRCPNRLPGGSSSGSAVGVATGDLDIGLGTDTGGSIRVPASYNGLFGIRTTHGIISTQDMVPLAPRFDTVGWLARDAQVLARVGEVLLPKARVALPDTMRVTVLDARPDGVPLWSEAQQRWLERQPLCQVVRHLTLDDEWLKAASHCFRVLQGREIWQAHGDWITSTKPCFDADIEARLHWARGLTRQQQRQAEGERLSIIADIARWFDEADLVVLPTTPGPAPVLGARTQWMDSYRSRLMGLTAPAGLAGLPQVHLPVLEIDGAPAGVSLLGKSGVDRWLIEVAAALDCSVEQSPI